MYLRKSVLITEQNMNISEVIERRYNRRRSVGCERNVHSDWMFNDVLHSSQCCKILLEPFQEDGLYLLAPSHCHSKTTLVRRTIWMFYWGSCSCTPSIGNLRSISSSLSRKASEKKKDAQPRSSLEHAIYFKPRPLCLTAKKGRIDCKTTTSPGFHQDGLTGEAPQHLLFLSRGGFL